MSRSARRVISANLVCKSQQIVVKKDRAGSHRIILANRTVMSLGSVAGGLGLGTLIEVLRWALASAINQGRGCEMGPTYHAPFERVHLAQGTWELSWWGKGGSCTTETQAGAEGQLKNRFVDSLVCLSSVPFTRSPTRFESVSNPSISDYLRLC